MKTRSDLQLRGGPFDGMKVHLVAADLCFFSVFDMTTEKFAFYSRSESDRIEGNDFQFTPPIAGALGGFLIVKRGN